MPALIEDTMNELEFIMGSVDTPMGAWRASLGYPEPWKINYVEIGNEDNLSGAETSYIDYRFPAFYDAISAKYPDIIIISSTGDTLAQLGSSATDYHEYARPDYYASQFGFFDGIANRSHLTLLGEYANIQGNNGQIESANFSEPQLPFGIWVGSVGEAIYTLGAERNSYGIIGASYAPGFQNMNSYEWAVSFFFEILQGVLRLME